jgi:predicted transcriptional regulator
VGEIQDQGQHERDAAIWAEWVSGMNQAEIGRRRGISQSAVSQACSRFAASIQDHDKVLFLLRALDRMEQLQQVFQPLSK